MKSRTSIAFAITTDKAVLEASCAGVSALLLHLTAYIRVHAERVEWSMAAQQLHK